MLKIFTLQCKSSLCVLFILRNLEGQDLLDIRDKKK
jgi:hypothetical protein